MSEDVTMTQEEIESGIEDAEAFVAGARARRDPGDDDDDDDDDYEYIRALKYARLVMVLTNRINEIAGAAARLPNRFVCFWCLHNNGMTDDAWLSADKMTQEEAISHYAKCKHNPLVHQLSALGVRLLHAEAGR